MSADLMIRGDQRVGHAASKSALNMSAVPPIAPELVCRNELTRCADFVAEVFCPSECVRLIQDQASMRNVDSRIHSLRVDCCVFLFYSFSAVTFATKSATSDGSQFDSRRLLFATKQTSAVVRLPCGR